MDPLNLVPTDVAADIFLRGVEEGSITHDGAITAAADVGGAVLLATRDRLDALMAFRPGCLVCRDPRGVRCCEFGRDA